MGIGQGPAERARRGDPAPDVVAAHFAELAAALGGDDDAISVQSVVAVAGRVLPRCRHAGITLIRGDRPPLALASTDELPRQVDALQYAVAEGPCLEASEGHDVVLSNDLRVDGRWPRFTGRCVAEFGVRSMLCVRLVLSKDDRAALNFYAEDVGAFDDLDIGISSILAPFAALVVERELHSTDVSNLERALATSRQIGMAVGVLMAQHGVTEEQAFALLRRASRHLNRKLRDVALDVMYTGELPQTSPPRPDTP